MSNAHTACPSCASEKVTTIQLPRHHEPQEQASTQRAFRCLGCDAQWVDDEQWQQLRSAAATTET